MQEDESHRTSSFFRQRAALPVAQLQESGDSRKLTRKGYAAPEMIAGNQCAGDALRTLRGRPVGPSHPFEGHRISALSSRTLVGSGDNNKQTGQNMQYLPPHNDFASQRSSCGGNRMSPLQIAALAFNLFYTLHVENVHATVMFSQRPLSTCRRLLAGTASKNPAIPHSGRSCE